MQTNNNKINHSICHRSPTEVTFESGSTEGVPSTLSSSPHRTTVGAHKVTKTTTNRPHFAGHFNRDLVLKDKQFEPRARRPTSIPQVVLIEVLYNTQTNRVQETNESFAAHCNEDLALTDKQFEPRGPTSY